jgi:hypothetical protein
MGTHESWSEVRRIFQESSDRHGADREAFLATVPDGPVLDEVRSLLATRWRPILHGSSCSTSTTPC